MTQPPLTPDTIAALSGRELDIAIAQHVFHIADVRQWDVDGDVLACVGPLWNRDYLFEYTHDDYRGLAAMVEKVRAAGWHIRMQMTPYDKWYVVLCKGDNEPIEAHGSTLPTAFARALLLTTLPENAR